jgi:F-type H+-transporting ATPase subunit b
MMEFLRDPETWIAAAFIVFIVAAGRPILRAMNKGLDERGARIKANLDEARRLREEAEALLASYQAKQRAAVEETNQIIARAHEEAKLLKQEAAANLEATLRRRERMALDKIAQAEGQAIAEVRSAAVDLAIAAATRILRQQMSGPKAASLINQSIADLHKKLH